MELRSADPLAKPRITLNLFAERADVEAMIRSVEMMRELYTTPPLGDLVAREVLPGPEVRGRDGIERWLRENLLVTHHSVGTCAMGHGPQSVVDPQLRVHGIEALRVCDASIMPTVPGGNTNAPSIMIGEKASDLVLGKSLPPANLPPQGRN